ncbi:MAG TPA: hypothetical protein VH393_09245 [Ktedonobacterales bacterium]
MSRPEGGYSRTYNLFDDPVSAQLRQEVYGEDIGQNSWLTANEYRAWLALLTLTPEAQALEVACGSGGPALFLARETGARVTGESHGQGARSGHTRAFPTGRREPTAAVRGWGIRRDHLH